MAFLPKVNNERDRERERERRTERETEREREKEPNVNGLVQSQQAGGG